MNLYHISQNVNNGYDTYSSAVVCAESEEAARKIHPRGYEHTDDEMLDGWARMADVQVELIGQAASHVRAGVVCSSYHAG